jgi:Na+/H+-translocating membrane pyrophosphatase
VAAARFKLDPLTIALAVVAVLCLAVGAAIVSGHPKRGALAFVVGAVALAGAAYAGLRAAKSAPDGPPATDRPPPDGGAPAGE